jgi:DivIVA domain-containing protein
VEQDAIERIRTATFSDARRGYDRQEVDTYLARLADWLEGGGGDQARSEIVKRELERVGQKTAAILTEAQDAAQSIRSESENEANEKLEAARRETEAARTEADEYAQKTRDEADRQAAAKIKDAGDEAARMVEDGQTRKREVEKLISDLEARRDAVLSGLERLSSEIAGTATQHKSDGSGAAGAEAGGERSGSAEARAPASKPAPAKPRAEPRP